MTETIAPRPRVDPDPTRPVDVRPARFDRHRGLRAGVLHVLRGSGATRRGRLLQPADDHAHAPTGRSAQRADGSSGGGATFTVGGASGPFACRGDPTNPVTVVDAGLNDGNGTPASSRCSTSALAPTRSPRPSPRPASRWTAIRLAPSTSRPRPATRSVRAGTTGAPPPWRLIVSTAHIRMVTRSTSAIDPRRPARSAGRSGARARRRAALLGAWSAERRSRSRAQTVRSPVGARLRTRSSWSTTVRSIRTRMTVSSR